MHSTTGTRRPFLCLFLTCFFVMASISIKANDNDTTEIDPAMNEILAILSEEKKEAATQMPDSPQNVAICEATSNNNQVQPPDSPITSSLMFQKITLPDDLVDLLWDMAPQKIKSLITSMQNFERNISTIPQIIVFYGPHGTGKSKMAALIAQKAHRKLIFINTAFLGTTYLNSETTNLGEAIAPIAQENTPCVIVIDEADILSHSTQDNDKSGRLDAAIAQMLDTYENNPNLFFVWTTNNVGRIEDKFLDRIGDNMYEITSPRAMNREKILNYYINQATGTTLDSNANIASIAKKTKGFSIRRLKDLVKEAHRIAALRSGSIVITQGDFEIAIAAKNLLKSHVDSASKKERILRHFKEHATFYSVSVPIFLAIIGSIFSYVVIHRSSQELQMRLAREAREQNDRQIVLQQKHHEENLAETISQGRWNRFFSGCGTIAEKIITAALNAHLNKTQNSPNYTPPPNNDYYLPKQKGKLKKTL